MSKLWVLKPGLAGAQGSGMRLRLRLDHGCLFSSSLFSEAGALQQGLAKALTGLTLSHYSQPISLQNMEVGATSLQEPGGLRGSRSTCRGVSSGDIEISQRC